MLTAVLLRLAEYLIRAGVAMLPRGRFKLRLLDRLDDAVNEEIAAATGDRRNRRRAFPHRQLWEG